MGKGKREPATASKKEASPPPQDEVYRNVNPGDTATVKGILDDTVVQAFDDLAFPEDHTMSNLKLGLGALACALALVAQFWPNPLKPMPFPESRGLLLACCVAYFAISFGLQLLATLYEKDSILYALAPKEGTCAEWMKGYRVRVGTTLARFSIDYIMCVEVTPTDKSKVAAGDTGFRVEKTLKLTDYFEEGGAFHEEWFLNDVKEVVQAMGTKKTH